MSAYIGNSPQFGVFRKLDAFAFNGSTTTFNILSGGAATPVGDPVQLFISLNGVIQEPGAAFTLATGGTQIVFSTAPTSGMAFFGIILGVKGAPTVDDGQITPAKLDRTYATPDTVNSALATKASINNTNLTGSVTVNAQTYTQSAPSGWSSISVVADDGSGLGLPSIVFGFPTSAEISALCEDVINTGLSTTLTVNGSITLEAVTAQYDGSGSGSWILYIADASALTGITINTITFSSGVGNLSVSGELQTANATVSGNLNVTGYTTGVFPSESGQAGNFLKTDGYGTRSWAEVVGGATGGTGNRVFYENDKTVSVNYAITTGKNAMTAGPVTIADGISVTIPDGSTWTIV